MLKTKYKILFIITLILGVFFTSRISVNANITTYEIYNYNDLPYGYGEVNIVTVNPNENEYDIYFVMNDNSVQYVRKSTGVPACYYHEKDYSITWKVEDDENNIKRIIVDFFESDGRNIKWELTSGKYLGKDIIDIPVKKLSKEPYFPSLLGTPHYKHFVHFNTDVQIDELYQVDIEFTTYEMYLFFKTNRKDHTVSIKNELIEYDNNIFNSLTDWIHGNQTYTEYTIQEDTDYDWKVEYYEDVDRVHVEDLVIIKLYYVTDGKYYEDPVNSTPISEPIGGIDIGELDNIKEKLQDIISWFKTNGNSIILVVVAFFVTTLLTALLPFVISVINIILKCIVSIIKGIILILTLPFKLIIGLFSIFSSFNKKQKLNYKKL